MSRKWKATTRNPGQARRAARAAQRRETQGRTRNLREDFTGGDWSRMEAQARRAMQRNAARMNGAGA